MYINAIRLSVHSVRRMRVGAFVMGAMIALGLWLAAPPAALANVPRFQNGDGISLVSQSQTGREVDLWVILDQ